MTEHVSGLEEVLAVVGQTLRRREAVLLDRAD